MADEIVKNYFFLSVEKITEPGMRLYNMPNDEFLQYIKEKIYEKSGFANINSNKVRLNLFLDVSDDKKMIGNCHIKSIEIYTESSWKYQCVPNGKVGVEVSFTGTHIDQVKKSMNFTENVYTRFV